LLWSDAVTVNTCRKTAFDGGELGPPTFFHSDCRSNPDFKGDLFSWCAVKKFGNFLCPNSWRVPTRQEFINLDLILGGTGENQSDIDLGNSYLNDWGGIFGGFCDSVGTLENQGSWARYWSQTRVTTTSGFPLRFGTGGTVILQSNLNKNLGLTLRCVRDCPRIILEIADETTRHQTVCQNEPIETVTHFLGGAVANATLSWSGGIFPNGITGDASSFSGIPTTAGTYAWTITATSSVDGCPPKISTGTITVNALPTKVTVTEISHCDSTILTASNETFGNCRIFWQNTTNNGKDTTIASTLQIVKEDGTYYFRARSLEGCWGEQGSRTVVINTAPVFYLHPDTTTRIVVQGGIFPKLTYYVSGVESDVRWYSNTTNSNIGGTLIPNLFYIPSSEVVGTLYYYFEASNSCGNTASNVSGAHIVEPITIDANGCNNATPGWGESLGTVSFATGSIWVVGNQIWSDAVQATSCNKVTFNSGIISNLNSDCRSNPGYPGDLFSWCAVARFQNQLCPGNWRVPTRQNFIDLDIALGGTGENMQHNTSYMSRYLSVWGGAFGGIGYSGHLEMQEQGGIYWSISQVAISHANVLIFKHPNFMVSYGPQYTQQKNNNASSLRCVRDTVCPVGTLLDVSMAGGNVLNGLKDRSPHNRAHLGDAAGLTVFDNTSLASVANSNKQGIYWDIPEMLTACKLTLEYEIHPTSYGNQHGLTLSFVYSADIYMTAGMLTRGGFDGGFTAFGWLCQKQPYERLPLGKWSKIKVELDFVASTIKTYINDVLWHSANATIPRTRQILIGASVLNHDVAVNCGLRNIKITQN
jgi:uncharacterized protein (TIGR02145 family)